MNEYERKQADRKARLENRAEGLRKESEATYSKAREMASVIPFGQPILIGHHSEQRDRNYRGRIHKTFGKSFELAKQAEEAERKAAAAGTGGISSDDPDAIAKLRAELAHAEKSQTVMKAANAAIRKNKTPETQAVALIALGLSAAHAAEALKPDFAGRVGFPAYALSNNNANMRRIQLRITELEAHAKRESAEKVGPGFVYREDTEENRVMFVFDGKPDATTRTLLKSHAFKWSPSRGAWVRQLNNAGIYHAKLVFEALKSAAIGDAT